MSDTGPAGRDSANRELKNRLKGALTRQKLKQADIVRQAQINGEPVGKATVSNALNPDKGPPEAATLMAILNAAGISSAERDELSRLRDQAERRGTTPLEAYLEAAEKAARRHPYPGVLGVPSLPALADVYVRQQARTPAANNQNDPAVPAAEVFREDRAMCVLLGGPGGGKSTLLCTHLADSADSWLDRRTGETIPVMVSAAALTGTDPLPTVLAEAVTANLRQVGLLDELTADFFRHPPRAGVSWLVLVDGIDEIPDTDTRNAVLTMLAGAAAAAPGLYRFVVATRPLPAAELGALGPHVPRYELQPFSRDDLHGYATHWFRPLDDPGRHVKAFIAGLKHSRLESLARIPLMALMLCQLYAADPLRPLPDGRTGAYQSFVELIYEQNAHKNIKKTHDEAIRRLKDRHQIPRDNQAAEQAAEQVRDHLPELIDHLAYERINGSTAPAVEILASHLQANRPQKVKEHLWHAFLGDLLRPTGILTQRADDLDFLHQTFLEFHAARHATRDEAARVQLLHDLFPHQEPSTIESPPQPPRHPSSYLGFLLDHLLGAGDSTATETTRRLEILAERGELETIQSLVVQVLDLKTNLPLQPIAGRLRRLVEQPSIYDPFEIRVKAAGWLSMLDGHLEAGADLLIQRVEDDGARIWDRVAAAGTLGQLEGYQETAAEWLTLFVRATLLEADERSLAAGMLARVEGYQQAGVTWLARFTEDTSLTVHDRIQSAKDLARVEGYQSAGVTWLARFAEDTSLKVPDRMQAAKALTEVREEREAGAAWLARFAEDATVDDYDRVWSAWQLALMDEYEEAAATMLTRFVEDTTFNGEDRIWAAWGLAQLDGHREAGIEWLMRFARDPALSGKAGQQLARVDKDAYASLLISIMEDTTQTDFARALAAWNLSDTDGHRQAGATWLASFAGSTEPISPAEAFERVWKRSNYGAE
ncbi:NACHT domain-containing protein [Streptomyces sp. NPDC059989]|uniref:NACHT domain-containing protein n=1 Tax=Streptomyces sp. NPDC059989 TaxID=3347026 RepID=UPI0036B6330B